MTLSLVSYLESEVSAARQSGDIDALLSIANAAIDRLEAAAEAGVGSMAENQLLALSAAMRIGYNVAADIWPGWEVGTPARTEAAMQAAQVLARRSGALVDRLGLGARRRSKRLALRLCFIRKNLR
jgi:hypothetical protein